MTHVARLNDTIKQAKSVETLQNMAAHKLSDEQGNRQGKTYKELIDKIIEPLNKLCTTGTMGDQAKTGVVKLLSDTWDARSAPCLNKILNEWTPGTGDTDALQVFRGAAASKMPELADAVMAAFPKVKETEARQDNLYRDVQDAFQALVAKSNEDLLLKLLDADMPVGQNGKPPDPKAVENQVYWQANAAFAIGKLKINDEKAINALIKVVLNPAKSNIQGAALSSLALLGTAVIKPAQALIKGDAKDLIEFSTKAALAELKPDAKKEEKDAAAKSHISVAATILGNIGTKDAIAPLIAALDGADDQTKALIANALPDLPHTEETMKAFKTVFETIKADTTMTTTGNSARTTLMRRMISFYDANQIPWILDQAKNVKGEAAEQDEFRQVALEAAMSLMKKGQITGGDKKTGSVQDLYDTKDAGGKPIGKSYEDAYNYSRFVLEDCGDDAGCYVKILTDPEYSKEPWQPPKAPPADPKAPPPKEEPHEGWNKEHKKNNVAGLKAIYMIGVLGDAAIKAKLWEAYPSIVSVTLKSKVLELLGVFSPDGDKDLVGKIQATIDDYTASKDDKKVKEASILKQLVLILNARSGG